MVLALKAHQKRDSQGRWADDIIVGRSVMASEGANIRMTLSRDRCDREIDLISRDASKVVI